MNLCINCRHAWMDYVPEPKLPDRTIPLCRALEGHRSYVTGQYIAYPHLSCETARNSSACGRDGVLFEPIQNSPTPEDEAFNSIGGINV